MCLNDIVVRDESRAQLGQKSFRVWWLPRVDMAPLRWEKKDYKGANSLAIVVGRIFSAFWCSLSRGLLLPL
jgi:hypothetical protein